MKGCLPAKRPWTVLKATSRPNGQRAARETEVFLREHGFKDVLEPQQAPRLGSIRRGRVVWCAPLCLCAFVLRRVSGWGRKA